MGDELGIYSQVNFANEKFNVRLDLALRKAGKDFEKWTTLIAELCECSDLEVSQWLSGTLLPHKSKYPRIAMTLSVSILWLQTGLGDMYSVRYKL